MARPLIVGVMGGGQVDQSTLRCAYELGTLIAQQNWILLNGGRKAGVMDASAHGAADHGGLTVGILPDANAALASEHIRIPICTGMGSARNTINVLSSDVVVACQGGAGTVSEIALALKHGKTVIALSFQTEALFNAYRREGRFLEAATPQQVIEKIRGLISGMAL